MLHGARCLRQALDERPFLPIPWDLAPDMLRSPGVAIGWAYGPAVKAPQPTVWMDSELPAV